MDSGGRGDDPSVAADHSPVADLVTAIHECTGAWLERCVVDTARAQSGGCPASLAEQARLMAATHGPPLVADLERLLLTDVDEQRHNPLMLYRAAVHHPTALLQAAGVGAVRRDEFSVRAFPDDVYGLSPATWSDIDVRLHEPGLMWGAWKAAVVLRRRRSEGRR